MSMNLSASINATLLNGYDYLVTERFDLYQTPTTVTRDIMKSENILQAYAAWMATTHINDQEHLRLLNEWVDKHYNEGWTIAWNML